MLPRDPVMLLSVINMKLRNAYQNLDALCEDLCVPREDIERALSDIGYVYHADTNQFV